jgi:hypothetical protein
MGSLGENIQGFLIKMNRNFTWYVNGRALQSKIDDIDFFSSNFGFVLSEFKAITPILARHHDFMPFQELELRRITFSTLRLAEELRDLDLKFIYFGYESSHHIHTVAVELAARILQIPQIFEFPLPGKKCMLFWQLDGIESRKVIPPMVTSDNFSSDQEILSEDFISPSHDELEPRRTKSASIAIFLYAFSLSKSHLFRLKQRLFRDSKVKDSIHAKP